jgi:hypothetical protein
MLGFSLLEDRGMTNTRKNFRLVPVPKERLVIAKAYSAFSRKDPKKDVEGFFTGLENGTPKFTGSTTRLAPESEYLYYPISASRKLLQRFGINVATLNTSFPARNNSFYVVPNYKRTLKSRRQSRKRVPQGYHSRFA